MTDAPMDRNSIECRLIVIETHSMRILTNGAPDSPELPRLLLPGDARVAETLTGAIEDTYGLSTIQLALLPGAPGYCAVHEVIDSRRLMHGSLSFTPIDKISSEELQEEDRATVLKIMLGEAQEFGRFARLGWIHELLARTESFRRQDSLPIIRHINQGIDFCLLSLTDSAGHRLWFKAVGEPNTREYALTCELARRFPAYLPKILLTIPEWNGWVMEHAEGVPLNETTAIAPCKLALTALARMQEEISWDARSLSALGASDWTARRIRSLSEPFFEEAQRAMQAQTSAKSRPMTTNELCRLEKDVQSALLEWMNAALPDTLLHGDIGHGNILATSKGPVFLDWAETSLGHPFLSAEHLVADLARSNPVFAGEQDDLRRHYASHWKTYLPPAELEKVRALAPAIGAFAYAVFAWDARRHRSDPIEAWPFLRSMLRRTWRELDRVSEVFQ
jgi:hypothetical protein